MNIQRSTLNLQRATRRREASTWLGVLLSLVGLVSGFAQANRDGATGYNATRYHPAPDFRQMEMKLTGSEATQLPGNGKQYRITRPHFTSYRKTGETEVIVETPECLFDETDPKARTLSSEQPLSMRTDAGDFSITGRGFRCATNWSKFSCR